MITSSEGVCSIICAYVPINSEEGNKEHMVFFHPEIGLRIYMPQANFSEHQPIDFLGIWHLDRLAEDVYADLHKDLKTGYLRII